MVCVLFVQYEAGSEELITYGPLVVYRLLYCIDGLLSVKKTDQVKLIVSQVKGLFFYLEYEVILDLI